MWVPPETIWWRASLSGARGNPVLKWDQLSIYLRPLRWWCVVWTRNKENVSSSLYLLDQDYLQQTRDKEHTGGSCSLSCWWGIWMCQQMIFPNLSPQLPYVPRAPPWLGQGQGTDLCGLGAPMRVTLSQRPRNKKKFVLIFKNMLERK